MAIIKSRFLFGITSPRNPERIPHYLNLLRPFVGRRWQPQTTQIEYYRAMVGNQLGDFDIGESRDPAFSARDKITRAPQTLGFVKLQPEIQITAAGEAFLIPELQKETLIRQMMKVQLPSPLHNETAINRGMFNIKPYLELLRMINLVGDLYPRELKLFGITMTDYHQLDQKITELRAYRRDMTNSSDPSRKFHQDYFENYISEIYSDEIQEGHLSTRESPTTTASDFVRKKIRNINDYGDAYIRYLIGSGLVSLNRNRQLIITPSKTDDVRYILESIPREACTYTLEEWQAVMFNPNLPILLTDDSNNVFMNINHYNSELGFERTELVVDSPISELKAEWYRLEQAMADKKVRSYVENLKQYNPDEIKDIFETFSGISRKEYFDNPLYLEWNCWRAITLINNGDIKGNFKVNTEGNPIGTAGGNMPDILGEYSDFNMICEVTLSSGRRQYEMENEPVMRHLGETRTRTGKETFGLFIAPTINDSVIAEFYYKHKISTTIYGGTIEFIPLSIKEFVKFFEHAVNRTERLDENDIKSIHLKSKEIADAARDELDWLNGIKEYIMNI